MDDCSSQGSGLGFGPSPSSISVRVQISIILVVLLAGTAPFLVSLKIFPPLPRSGGACF